MIAPITLIISDVHTRYGVINEQILHVEKNLNLPVDQVFVLGDFGFYGDELHDFFRRNGQRFLRPVFCIEGNHEDHGALPGLVEAFWDVFTYLPRGQVHKLSGFNGLCLGGAQYMDAHTTPRGCEISEADISACLAHDHSAIDVVLTHDCPAGINVPNTPGFEHYGPPGVPEMGAISARYLPKTWFFGHHHRWHDETRLQTRYIGLPHSWEGFALLGSDGQVDCITNRVNLKSRSWWRRVLGR